MPVKGHVIVVVMAIFTPLSIILLYTFALVRNHIRTVITFISVVGNRPIESCIFSFIFNLKGAMQLVLYFMRYLQLLYVIENSRFPERRKEKLRGGVTCSLWCGFLGCFGYTLMAAFQNNVVKALHVLGIFFVCFFNFVFFVYQTYFTFALTIHITSIFVRVFRISITFTMLILEAYLPFHFTFLVFDAAIKNITILPSDPIYIAGVFVEWMFLLCVELYVLSFYSDFKFIELHVHKFVFLEKKRKQKNKQKNKERIQALLNAQAKLKSIVLRKNSLETEDV